MGICVFKRFHRPTNDTKNTMLNSEPIQDLLSTQAQTLNDKYILKKVLGKGKFGIVRKAVHKNNPDMIVAIKTIHKNSKVFDIQLLLREINILKSIDHPNIIKFYEFFEEQTEIHIVMEFCSGGELFEKIVDKGKFTEKEAAGYLRKMFAAVNHLHLLGVCHRDLKPQNFLFETNSEDSELKLIDFGLSNKSINNIGGFKMTTMVGTPFYLAPEILQGGYDIKCDLWSLGITMHFMLVGDYPFKGTTNAEIFKKISSATEADSSALEGVSSNAADLLKKLLVKNPQFRICAKEALNHSWFKEFEDYSSPQKEDLQFLKNYKPSGPIQQAARGLIVKYLNGDELKQLRETFFYLDSKKNGYLTADEVKEAIKVSGSSMSNKQMNKLFRSLSANQDGKIYYSEFISAAFNSKVTLDDDKLMCTFKLLDTENSGYISADSLIDMYRRSGKTFLEGKDSKENWDKLNFEDFKRLVTQH